MWRLITLLLVLLILCFCVIFYRQDRASEAYFEAKLNNSFESQKKLLETILDSNIQDARRATLFLASTPPISGIARATLEGGYDEAGNTDLETWKRRLETIFYGYLKNNPQIVQIRYLGVANEGLELVRVERKEQQIQIVQANHMQQKSGEFYFQEALDNRLSDVFISAMTFNREHGEIEFPTWITYRSIRTVLHHGEPFGLIVINLNAEAMIEQLQLNTERSFDLYMTNSNNEFVALPEGEERLGDPLNSHNTWAKTFEALGYHRDLKGVKLVKRKSDDQVFFMENYRYWLSKSGSGEYVDLHLVKPLQDFITLKNAQRQYLMGVFLAVFIFVLVLLYAVNVFTKRLMVLNQTQSVFEAIFNASQDAMILLEPKGTIVSLNRSAETMFGLSATEAMGCLIWDLFTVQEDSVISSQTLAATTDGMNPGLLSTQVRTRKGTDVDISATLSRVVSRGDVIWVSLIIRDITDQKDAQKKILALNKDLESQVEERTKELVTAHRQALEASKAKSIFVANISHEIRTPLNGIIGMLRLLESPALSDDQKRYLEMAKNSSSTLLELINDVLDLSKIESGKLYIEEKEFNLVSLLSSLAATMSLKSEERELDFVFDIAGIDHENVVGDEHYLKQVISNLIGNAIKFTHEGEIRLVAKTEEEQGQVVLACSIQDTGIGISEAKVQQLFSPFVQEDSSTTKIYGGTGLGLSICRKLCRLMDGDIWFERMPLGGSNFSFRIKLNESSNQQKIACDFTGKKILVISQSASCNQTLSKLLTKWGADVTVCETLASAETHCQSDRLDVVFIDWRFGEFNAFSLVLAAQYQTTELRPRIVLMRRQLDPLPNPPHLSGFQQHIMIHPISPLDLDSVFGATANAVEGDKCISEDETLKNELKILCKGKKVIIADDNKVNRAVLNGLLRPYKMEVLFAETGQMVIDLLKQHHSAPYVSLIFMDCHMPVMDGYAATQQIRAGKAGEAYVAVPIMACTANALSGERDHCLDVGMDDYMAKPVNARELRLKLMNWFRRFQESAES